MTYYYVRTSQEVYKKIGKEELYMSELFNFFLSISFDGLDQVELNLNNL